MKTTKITIPGTIEEAVSCLNGLGALLTAKEWERAAIVRAFCQKLTPQQRNKKSVHRDPGEQRLSISAFAQLRITGFVDPDAVMRYYRAWDSTGLPTPEPGQKVTLPDAPFPSFSAPGAVRRANVAKTLKEPDERAELIKTLLTEHADEVRAALPSRERGEAEPAPAPEPAFLTDEEEAQEAELRAIGERMKANPPSASASARFSVMQHLRRFAERDDLDVTLAFDPEDTDTLITVDEVEPHVARALALLDEVQKAIKAYRKAALTLHVGGR